MKLQCGPSMTYCEINTFLGNIYLFVVWYIFWVYIAQNDKMVYTFPKRVFICQDIIDGPHSIQFILFVSSQEHKIFIENLEPLWKPADSLIDLHFTFIFLSGILQRPTRRSLSPRKSSLRPEEKAKTIVSKKSYVPSVSFPTDLHF